MTRLTRAQGLGRALLLTLSATPMVSASQDVVGQITAVSSRSFSDVEILRDRRPHRASQYSVVLSGDQICLRRRGITAELTLRGGRTYTIPGPLFPIDRQGCAPPIEGNPSPWDTASLGRLFAAIGAIFAKPSDPEAEEMVDTSPQPLRGESIEADPLLPRVRQTVRASSAGLILPVVWRGAPATVTLQDASGSVLATAHPDLPGQARLYAPGLEPGAYRLQIGQGAHRLTIPVDAAPGPAGPASDVAATLAAADAIKGPPSGRLQALADLVVLANRDYVAYAVLRKVVGGARAEQWMRSSGQ